MTKEILVIDDNSDIRELISSILEEQGLSVRQAANYDQALFEINKKLPDVAIIDVKLDKGDNDGIELLSHLKKIEDDVPVIMISGHANVQMAVDSLKLGAFEFIQKPFSSERLLNFVNRAIENVELKKDKQALESKLFHSYDIIGKSQSIQKLKSLIVKLSNTESRIFISGPAGSGKELVARQIHKQSSRTKKPMVVARKRSYGLKGEICVNQSTGYSKGEIYINDLNPGERVLILDDVLSTGGTILSIIEGVEKSNAIIESIIVIFEKGNGLQKVVDKTNIDIKSLIRVDMDGDKVVFQ